MPQILISGCGIGEKCTQQKRYQSRNPIESSACECHRAITAMSLSRLTWTGELVIEVRRSGRRKSGGRGQ